ncbi:MAG: hypothetical protein KKH98_06340, partial [Spirochaetes bacterium]|nr:hypothetical protein [Spirochaetota bacterium]
MKTDKLIILIIILMMWNTTGHTSFEDLGFGARASCLGTGYVGLSDDMGAVYYNPSGLAQLKQNEAMLSFTRLHWGLGSNNTVDEDNILYMLSCGYVHDFNIVHLGIGYNRFALDSYYNENTFIISSGTELRKLIKSLKKLNLNAGLNLKILTKSFAKDIYTSVNPVFVDNGYSETGYGMDFGLLYKMYKMEQLSIGMAVENVFSSDMGIQNEDRINRRISLGVAYILEGKYLIKDSTWLNKFIPLVGVKLDGNDPLGGIGAEVWFLKNG